MAASGREEQVGNDTTQLAAFTPRTPGEVRTPSGDPGQNGATFDRVTGTDLDHFHVERPLGRGGMGAVYLAHDTSLDRHVAIKVLPDHVHGNPELEERFLHEARAQARLASPNVVAIHYIGRVPTREGRERGGLFFAMEWVDGEPLEAVLARRSMLAPEEARRAMIHVARGLRDAHRAGIIHRDIKPSNLLRDRDGWVKIADFGIAKQAHVRPLGEGARGSPRVSGEVEKQLTAAGAVLGTPLYMAPEQASGSAIDFRADQYALGCTFYHLVTGVPPFDANTAIAIAAKHVAERPVPIVDRVKDVPPKLAAIVMKLLAKKPSERYETYEALIAELEAAAPESVAHAGFWARGAANMIDVGLAGMLIATVGWYGVAIHLLYVTVGHAYFGRTIPKWMLGMRVEKKDGSRLGFARSFVRTVTAVWLPLFLAMMTLVTKGASHLQNVVERLQPNEAAEAQSIVLTAAISHGILTLLWAGGLAMAAFDPERRAFHDLLVGSRVRYRLRSVTPPEKLSLPA